MKKRWSRSLLAVITTGILVIVGLFLPMDLILLFVPIPIFLISAVNFNVEISSGKKYERLIFFLIGIQTVGSITFIFIQQYADMSLQLFCGLLFSVYLFKILPSESLSNKSALFAVVAHLFALSIALLFPSQNTTGLLPSQTIRTLAVLSVFLLVIYGIIADEIRMKRVTSQIVKNESTLNWFGTFSNLVSHNLRTPLATVMTNATLIEAKYPSLNEGEELTRIKHSVKTMNTIVERLVRATFISSNVVKSTLKQTLERGYPDLVIKSLQEPEFSTYDEEVSILLSLEVFLDNAFKYSNSKVELSFEVDCIKIRDFGPGLSEEQIHQFGNLKASTLGSLHGIGIPFALRLLDAVGIGVRAENKKPGLEVSIGYSTKHGRIQSTEGSRSLEK